MTVTAALGGWNPLVYLQLWGLSAVVTVLTFHPAVSVQIQSYALMTFGMAGIFTYSAFEGGFYPSVVAICAFSSMIAIYKDKRLMLSQVFLSAVFVLFHVLVFRTVEIHTGQELSGFFMRITIMIGCEIFLCFFIDMLNRTEENLRSSLEHAQKAEVSKSDFLANMSHEIRTPMNAIVGMCELILREKDVTDNIREHCYNIQTSGKSLLSIINDILDFSKIESGKMEIIEEPFNIASTLNDAVNIAITRKGSKRVELIVHVDPDIPQGLIGDEIRIRQIIINLVSNAVKFTNEGSVTLKVSQTKHDYGINLNVSVSDTGVGITEENLEKLFVSFQQVDTKKNRSVEGTGLGLAISKRLIEKMGGFINVSSEYGVGSEFRFVIPLKVSDETPFIKIDEPEKIHAAVYTDYSAMHISVEKEYRRLFKCIRSRLKTDFIECQTEKELKRLVADGKITHCFIGRKEYLNNGAYYDSISEKTKVMVIQERADAVSLHPGVKCIYKPFYMLPVASVFNNENLILNLNERRGSSIRFSAPDAKILIVDDNVINLKVAAGLMRPYAMQTDTAESGSVAISMLKSKDYDLVFMDHMMPEMDGVETTRKIRELEDEYFKKLPVVALTANAVNGVRDMFIQSGFNDFMAKPIELSVLDRILKTYLPKERIKPPVCLTERSGIKKNSNRKTSLLFDPEKGLLYTGGEEDTYNDILALFVKKAPEKRNYIDLLFEREDWKNYIIEVHALKSSARSIGAETLSILAKELELSGKAMNYNIIKEKNCILSEMYEAVTEAVANYLGIDSAPEITPEEEIGDLEDMEYAELSRQAEKIISACEAFDSDEVVKLVQKISDFACNGYSLKNEFAKVVSLADDFEYEAAAEETKAIMTRLGG